MFGEPQKLKDALKAYVASLNAIRLQVGGETTTDPAVNAANQLKQLDQRVRNIEDFLLSMHDAGF